MEKNTFIRNGKTYTIICSTPDGFYLCDVGGTPTMVSANIIKKAK